MIGPGVSENSDQVINLTAPHGFSVGGASMPHGVVNNQHMHYTAEVFICTRGRWQMRLGQHGDQRVDVGPGTVFSVPPWVFRGFQNIGGDDTWLFAVLGGDDTGGILWAPQVLEAAADSGLYLSADHAVLDAAAGDRISEVVGPVDESRLVELDSYTDDEIRELIVSADQLEWSSSALLSGVLDGHASAVAPVIGFGLTEDRRAAASNLDASRVHPRVAPAGAGRLDGTPSHRPATGAPARAGRMADLVQPGRQ